ncbi:hypothetical protein GE061_019840 [Apolygus lucorum]|uniref:Uncharacterized protein n=1 Tax=Apolygus lucorum TaxID=248454 RepID=A0A6A4J9A8_APOLU|nr:hypothetical protein GE061_019840 [Apolygus lucorum]
MESQQIATELLYRVQHLAQQESRLQTILRLDIELPERKNCYTSERTALEDPLPPWIRSCSRPPIDYFMGNFLQGKKRRDSTSTAREIA